VKGEFAVKAQKLERLASPQMRLTFGDGLVMDYFAGGGGASEGIEWAIGRPVNVAINHNKVALAMHKANHPHTKHYPSDVWEVDPRIATRGKPVDFAWFSPDCKHFSRAKGAKPVEKKIRGLAWVKVKVAATVRPSICVTENVPEFLDWGPLIQKLDKDGSPVFKDGEPVLVPDPDRKGETFKAWVKALRELGYKVEWKMLRACDYGAPTTRERLFVVARCDGKPIRWPKPTHGTGSDLLPYRTAAECIDWSIPSYSIFLTKDEAKEFNVRRPLATNTLRRIARGLEKFVINNPTPFIVSYYGPKNGEFRGTTLDHPLPTQTTENRFGLVTPYLARICQTGFGGNRLQYSLEDPLTTITTKAEHCLISPYMVPRYGERPGQEPRCLSLESPMPTITTTANNGSLVAACCVRQFGKSVGHKLDSPVQTITAGGGGKTQLMTAFLAKHYTGVDGQSLDKPIGTITAVDHHSLVASHLIKLRGTCQHGAPLTEPMPTITAGGFHLGEVRTLMTKGGVLEEGSLVGLDEEQRYQAWWVARFLEDHTDRVDSIIPGPRPAAIVVGDYVIVDIGLRMLAPPELFKAQGFGENYIHDRDHEGNRITATNQVKMCGNSVSPYVAKALTEANYGVSGCDIEEDEAVA
jgi:DNA (cytosine-5)-methyltransferase 1